MRLLTAIPYRLVSAVQCGAAQRTGLRMLATATQARSSGPVDERESKEIYTTIGIDPNEPKFDKILIANRDRHTFVYTAYVITAAELFRITSWGLFVLIMNFITLPCVSYIETVVVSLEGTEKGGGGSK
ncbi:unnamed protein product [Cylicostephanus goldi]|uniref:Uncharacterized protein n=1 Tax=Cylicostephanus goldi TaxID=71465 RepID=A0A3P6SCL8_CYLGO|nr:unnamed protein product [Cylicostephanus goldi]